LNTGKKPCWQTLKSGVPGAVPSLTEIPLASTLRIRYFPSEQK
jgi:hypothetical protein